jgi:predicted RNA-binding protein YlqC (UPF0109 family)
MRLVTEVLGALARALVDRPAAVRVRERQAGHETILELDVHPGDRGRIIGRGGETIRAMRRLLTTLARKHGQRCRIEVTE